MSARAVRKAVEDAAAGYADCRAGYVFQLYYPSWGAPDWAPAKDGKIGALRRRIGLGSAKKLLDALRERQCVFAETLPADTMLMIDAWLLALGECVHVRKSGTFGLGRYSNSIREFGGKLV